MSPSSDQDRLDTFKIWFPVLQKYDKVNWTFRGCSDWRPTFWVEMSQFIHCGILVSWIVGEGHSMAASPCIEMLGMNTDWMFLENWPELCYSCTTDLWIGQKRAPLKPLDTVTYAPLMKSIIFGWHVEYNLNRKDGGSLKVVYAIPTARSILLAHLFQYNPYGRFTCFYCWNSCLVQTLCIFANTFKRRRI